MICRNCIRAWSRSTPNYLSSKSHSRYLSTSSVNFATAQSISSTSNSPTPPTSSSNAGTSAKSRPPRSSIRAGAVLKGLNIYKNQNDPIAMRDEEYPDWLWKILPDQASGKHSGGDNDGGDVGPGDLYAKSAKQRKKAAKAQRKQEALNAGREKIPNIPIEEQSIDLFQKPGTQDSSEDMIKSNAEAGEARLEITKAMRTKRRGSIKEANFLKSMS